MFLSPSCHYIGTVLLAFYYLSNYANGFLSDCLAQTLKLVSSWTYSICFIPIYIWLSNFHTRNTYLSKVYLLNVKYVLKVSWHDTYLTPLQTIKYQIKDKTKKYFFPYECFFWTFTLYLSYPKALQKFTACRGPLIFMNILAFLSQGILQLLVSRGGSCAYLLGISFDKNKLGKFPHISIFINILITSLMPTFCNKILKHMRM